MGAHSLSSHPIDPRQWAVSGTRTVAAFTLGASDRSLDRHNMKINVSCPLCCQQRMLTSQRAHCRGPASVLCLTPPDTKDAALSLSPNHTGSASASTSLC